MSNPFFVNINTHPTSTFTLHTTHPSTSLSLTQSPSPSPHHPSSLRVNLTPHNLSVSLNSSPPSSTPTPTIRSVHPPLLLGPEYGSSSSSSSTSAGSTRKTHGGFVTRENRVLATHPDDIFRVGRYEGSIHNWELLAKRVQGLDHLSGSAGESGGERERERGRGYNSGRSRRR